MTNHFDKLNHYLGEFRKRYFQALNAFYLVEAIEKAKAPNVDPNAKKNVDIMKKHNVIFTMSRFTLNYYFLIELAKMYDDAKESLHINKLVNFVRSNRTALTKAQFLEHNSTRPFADELAKRYRQISRRELEAIRKKLSGNSGIINKLTRYRNETLAHDDIKKDKIVITRAEIISLFRLLEQILRKLYLKFDFSVSSFSNIENDCNASVKHLLESLKMAEGERIRSIEARYGVKISQNH